MPSPSASTTESESDKDTEPSGSVPPGEPESDPEPSGSGSGENDPGDDQTPDEEAPATSAAPPDAGDPDPATEADGHTLTIRVLDFAGRPHDPAADDAFTTVVITEEGEGQGAYDFDIDQGVATGRLPAGVYTATTVVTQRQKATGAITGEYLLTATGVALDADTTIVLDARKAADVQLTPPGDETNPPSREPVVPGPGAGFDPHQSQTRDCTVSGGSAAATGWLSADQMANAAAIYAVGAQQGLPERAMVIALATAMQESTFHNYGHLGERNDHDSLGLFQQRPSQGWGSPAEVTDPTYAAAAFYASLTRIGGWQQLPLTVAAQAVQRSAFPHAYAKHEPLAATLAADLSGGITCTDIPTRTEDNAGPPTGPGQEETDAGSRETGTRFTAPGHQGRLPGAPLAAADSPAATPESTMNLGGMVLAALAITAFAYALRWRFRPGLLPLGQRP